MIFRRVKSRHKKELARQSKARLDDSKEPKTRPRTGSLDFITESPGSGSYGLGFRVNLNLGFFSLGLLKREEDVVFLLFQLFLLWSFFCIFCFLKMLSNACCTLCFLSLVFIFFSWEVPPSNACWALYLFVAYMMQVFLLCIMLYHRNLGLVCSLKMFIKKIIWRIEPKPKIDKFYENETC